MRSKTLLLIGILYISTLTSDAQVNKWLNKQKKKLQEKEYVKKLNPKEYVKKKINESFYLNNYVNNITYKYEKLKTTLHNNVNLYNNTNSKFKNEFYTTKSPNNQLTYLEEGLINKRYPISINYNNEKYNLFKKNDFLIAVSDNKMPLDQNLENIIKTAFWSSQTKNLNSSYISNLKSLSKLNSEFYGYILLFYDVCIDVFNKIDNIGYGQITATNLIDEYSNTLGYNFSISGTKSSFDSYRDELKEIQNLSNRINSSCNTFLEAKQNLDKSGNASYKDSENSLKSFKSISKDINTLANQIAKQKQTISRTRNDLSKLSSFYGISFIESIGNLYKYLEAYYGNIEAGTRKHADNFNKYVEDVNTSSNQLYKNTKTTIDKVSNKQIKEELTYLNGYISIYNDINTNEFKNLPNDKYVQYLNNINQLSTQLIRAKEVDFIEFHKSKTKLRQLYDNFPVENAQKYYKTILSLIDNKQIIGGKYLQTNSDGFKTKLALIKADKSKVKDLVRSGQSLNDYYEKAKNNNIIFYVIIIGLVVFSILGFVIRNKTNKRKV